METFPRLSETQKILFTSLSVTISVVGTIGNSLVLITFAYNRCRFLTTSNTLLLPISLCDFLSALLSGSIITISSWNGQWPFSDSMCIFYAFLMTFVGLINITHLTGIAVERFLALDMPFIWVKVVTVKNLFILSCILICYCFVFALFPVLGWSSYTLEGLRTSCSLNWHSKAPEDVSFHAILFIILFCIPVTIIFISYMRVIKAVKKLTKRAREVWGNESIQIRSSAHAEKKLAIMVGIVTIFFLTSWLPYATVSFISFIGYPQVISPLAATIPGYMAKTSIIYNPFIYFLKSRRFRHSLKKCFQRYRYDIPRRTQVRPAPENDN